MQIQKTHAHRTCKNFYKLLRQKRFVRKNYGVYASVFIKDKLNYIWKVGPIEDGWLDYAVKTRELDNPYRPKILAAFILADGYAAKVERLYHGNHPFPDRKLEKYFNMSASMLKRLKRIEGITSVKSFLEIVEICKQIKRKKQLDWDLHDKNILLRKNGDMVINDPLCPSCT